jgi:hypothetical protein
VSGYCAGITVCISDERRALSLYTASTLDQLSGTKNTVVKMEYGKLHTKWMDIALFFRPAISTPIYLIH